MTDTYEGVTIDCGLTIKNGQIQATPIDSIEIKQRIDAMQKPQPHTIARRKALAESLAKKRK